MCHLIFTDFPERYQMVTMRNRQVRTRIPIKTGRSAKPHGQRNRDSDPGQLSWQWQQPILIIIVTSLPLLNVKNKPHIRLRISLHLIILHCTTKSKTNPPDTYSIKGSRAQPLPRYVTRYPSKSMCLQSHQSKIVLPVDREKGHCL